MKSHNIAKFIIFYILLFSLTSCENINQLIKQEEPKESIVEVAILLPITAKSALAQEYVKMIKTGLKDYAKSKIRVATYNSSTRVELIQSLNEIKDKGVDIIIGGLSRKANKIISDKIKDTNIIFFSLRNEPVFADDRIFVFGHGTMRKLIAITNHYLENKHKNYVLLLPSHQREIGKILEDLILTHNKSNSVKLDFYQYSPEKIEKLFGDVSDYVSEINEDDTNLTKPVILISTDIVTSELLSSNFEKYNLTRTAIIGSDIEMDSLSDMSFAGVILNPKLKMRIKESGIKYISSRHKLAYDAGAIVANYAEQDYNKSIFLAKLHKDSFDGISGKIGFIDSIAHRKYNIIKKSQGNYEIISDIE